MPGGKLEAKRCCNVLPGCSGGSARDLFSAGAAKSWRVNKKNKERRRIYFFKIDTSTYNQHACT